MEYTCVMLVIWLALAVLGTLALCRMARGSSSPGVPGRWAVLAAAIVAVIGAALGVGIYFAGAWAILLAVVILGLIARLVFQ